MKVCPAGDFATGLITPTVCYTFIIANEGGEVAARNKLPSAVAKLICPLFVHRKMNSKQSSAASLLEHNGTAAQGNRMN